MTKQPRNKTRINKPDIDLMIIGLELARQKFLSDAYVAPASSQSRMYTKNYKRAEELAALLAGASFIDMVAK